MVFVSQNPPTLPYTNWICMREPTCAEGYHLVDVLQASLSLLAVSGSQDLIPFPYPHSLTGSLKQDRV